MEWFEQNLIASVPMRYPGAFRRVYPGFVQLAAFMAMNIDRHVKAHRGRSDVAKITGARVPVAKAVAVGG
jgi:poly-beta-hydroxyalkanoate depolymerase